MHRIIQIDNLSGNHFKHDYSQIASDIYELVTLNLNYSNTSTYDNDAFQKLKQNKTATHIIEMIRDSFVICIYSESKLIACGFVKEQDDRIFSKSLHVHPEYRGRGLAQYICDEREAFVRSMGIKEVYIESLKFNGTLRFHESRGFKVIPPYKPLKNTVLMMKFL